MSLSTIFHNIWRSIVFFGGDIHRIHSFPYFSWDQSGPPMDYAEALEALKFIKPGDIGLHREWGYLSNIAIPGFTKHAWIHVNPNDIVEAVSEGVLRRNALHPIISTYVIILRPKNVTAAEIQRAIDKANKIVGCQYDTDFQFDIESELALFNEPQDRAIGKDDLAKGLKNLQKWDGGFSCTETVSFAFWHKRNQLGITRARARGKDVILGDSFINPNFEIVWMSKSITPKVANKLGLHQVGVEMINRYFLTHTVDQKEACVSRCIEEKSTSRLII